MLHGLLVLLFGERVHRTELLAPAGEPLDARLQIGAGVLVERLLAGRGIEAEPGRYALQLRCLLRGAVARLRSAHLRGRDRLDAFLRRSWSPASS